MYVSMDCEMGGLSDNMSLLQVGLIFVRDDWTIEKEVLLNVKPEDEIYHVTGTAMSINKIDLAKHTEIAFTYKDAKTHLYNLLKMYSDNGRNKLILVGKNVFGDCLFIWKYLLSRPTWEQFVSYRHLEISTMWKTAEICKKVPILENTSLKDIGDYFNLDTNGLHNALNDARLILECAKRLTEIFAN